MARNDEVEISVTKRGGTDAAIKVFDGKIEVWIPKSQITDESTDRNGNLTSIFIPEWLAEEKGLI